MLTQHFFVDRYNWEVYVFYYVRVIYRNSIIEILKNLGCKKKTLQSANRIIGKINGGMCYSNLRDRVSILIINETTNKEELYDTLVHELNHLSSHIEEYYKINSHGEEACYLIGNLAKKVFSYLLK